MNSAKTTPISAGIGDDRAMPTPAPMMKAAMAIDLPRKPVAQLISVVYIVWNSVPVVPARALPAKRARPRARRWLRRGVVRGRFMKRFSGRVEGGVVEKRSGSRAQELGSAVAETRIVRGAGEGLSAAR